MSVVIKAQVYHCLFYKRENLLDMKKHFHFALERVHTMDEQKVEFYRLEEEHIYIYL